MRRCLHSHVQDIRRLLWTPVGQYHSHNSLSQDSALSHMHKGSILRLGTLFIWDPSGPTIWGIRRSGNISYNATTFSKWTRPPLADDPQGLIKQCYYISSAALWLAIRGYYYEMLYAGLLTTKNAIWLSAGEKFQPSDTNNFRIKPKRMFRCMHICKFYETDIATCFVCNMPTALNSTHCRITVELRVRLLE